MTSVRLHYWKFTKFNPLLLCISGYTKVAPSPPKTLSPVPNPLYFVGFPEMSLLLPGFCSLEWEPPPTPTPPPSKFVFHSPMFPGHVPLHPSPLCRSTLNVPHLSDTIGTRTPPPTASGRRTAVASHSSCLLLQGKGNAFIY